MIEITDQAAGFVVAVLAHPSARKTGVLGAHAGALRIATTEAPERGKASVAIARILAAALGIKPAQVELLSGASSRRKRFLIRGIDRAELAARLRSLVAAQNSEPSHESA